MTPVEVIALSGCTRPENGRGCSICLGAAERHVRAVEAGGMVVVPESLVTVLPTVSLDDPCVECREGFEKGDQVSWRLRFQPQGLIHEECK